MLGGNKISESSSKRENELFKSSKSKRRDISRLSIARSVRSKEQRRILRKKRFIRLRNLR